MHTHIGFTPALAGCRRVGRLGAATKQHALFGGPARPYQGATYRALCGRVVRCEDDGTRLCVRPVAEAGGWAVTCRRCREAMVGGA